VNPVTRLLIADDHAVVRSGLRKVLEADPRCEVIAEASDGKEAIVKALETEPDIAVVDYSLPLINGVEVTRQIRKRLPKTEVAHPSSHTIVRRRGDHEVCREPNRCEVRARDHPFSRNTRVRAR
jgi:DNA-binding NarL/FixJ family response regulator